MLGASLVPALGRISGREGAPPPLPRSRTERAQDGSFPPAAPALPAPQPAPNLRCGQGLPRCLCWCAPQTQKTADSASSRGSSGRASDLGYGGQKPGLHLGAAQGSREEKPPQKGPPGASEWGSGTDGRVLGKAQEFPESAWGSCPAAHRPLPAASCPARAENPRVMETPLVARALPGDGRLAVALLSGMNQAVKCFQNVLPRSLPDASPGKAGRGGFPAVI